MSEIGKITLNTDRGKSIIDVIKNNNINTIVEIGTWKGGGTTTCVLENITPDVNFISIETNEDFYNEAKNNLSEYINKYEKFKLIHGRIVDMKEVARFFNGVDLNSHPEVTPEQHLNWFLEDFHNFNKCENILNKIPSEIDLLILDGGEYSTQIEWSLLKDKTKIVVLEDITMLKTKSIYDDLNKNLEYECLKHIGYEGNGFAIFKKKDINKAQPIVPKETLRPIISQENVITTIEPKQFKNGIITATNSPYYESLLGLISSVHKFGYELIDNITVYDIGLSEDEVRTLNNLSKVTVIQFTEAEKMFHPEFLVGKSHVYKNYCLHHASKFINNVLWIDSGACFINNFNEIFDKIYDEDIFLVGDIHINKDYTHSECVDIMGVTNDELMSNQLWSGLVGFKSDGKYQELINLSSMYSLIPNCCNGNHQNHRHDQSILSILASRYNCPRQDIDIYGYWTDSNRNLQTAINNEAIIFVHRRGHHDVSGLKYKNI